MTSAITDTVQLLYIAYFGRPADPAGLAYWQTQLTANGGDTAALSAAFGQSAEYSTDFKGLSNEAAINAVYAHLFNRAPDAAGLAYWSGHLADGSLSTANIVDAIAASAFHSTAADNSDAQFVSNKVAGADQFTNLLSSDPVLDSAYATADAAQFAAAYLSRITDAASLAAATSSTALDSLGQSLQNSGHAAGKSFTLTTGADTFTGTGNNDVINSGATATTLNAGDRIDGGNGVDTLNLTAQNIGTDLAPVLVNTQLVGSVSNVEVINIVGSDLIGPDDPTTGEPVDLHGLIDASFFGGAQQISVDGINTEVSNIAAGQTVIFDKASGFSVDSVVYDDAVTSATVGLKDNSGVLFFSGLGLSTLTVSGSTHEMAGAPSDALLIENPFGIGTLGTLNLALANDSTVDLTFLTDATRIDASASSGGINLLSVPDTVSTIITGAGNDTVTLAAFFDADITSATVATGAGNDNITIYVSGSGTYAVSAGSGNDVIELNPGYELAAGDRIDGGSGIDTLVLDNDDTVTPEIAALLVADVRNVENLEFANYVTIDGAQFTEFSQLTFDTAATVVNATQSLSTHGSLDAAAPGFVAATSDSAPVYAGKLNVTDDGSSSWLYLHADSAVVQVNAAAFDSVVSITGELKTLLAINTVNATNAVPGAAASSDTVAYVELQIVTGAEAAGDTLADLQAITASGNGFVFIDNTNVDSDNIIGSANKLSNIDASSLGGHLSMDTPGLGLKGDIVGGLIFAGNANVAETIKLGSGQDTLYLASSYGLMDTVSGFDAVKETASGNSTTDVLSLDAVHVIDGTTAGQVIALTPVSAYTSLNVAFAAAATAAGALAAGTVIQFHFGGNTYLFEDNPVAGSTAGQLDASDYALKLTGSLDLSAAFAIHA